MSEKKVYILQKDLPDSKAGDEYICLTNNFSMVYYKNGDRNESYWTAENVENNLSWFKLKEEVNPAVDQIWFNNIENIKVRMNNGSATIDISSIRLAEILIAESKGQLFMDNPKYLKSRQGRYTEKEYMDFGKECFSRSRMKHPEGSFKYITFDHFIASI